MKKLLLFISVALLTAGMLTSCKDKKAPESDQPQSMFTKEDTVKVRELTDQFINCMKNKDIKAAVEMLSFLDGDSIKPFRPQDVKRQAFALSIMSGKPGYEVEFVKLRDLKDNEIKINIELFEKQEGDTRPNTTALYLRPVRFEGNWYLTTRDNFTDTNSKLRLEHADE